VLLHGTVAVAAAAGSACALWHYARLDPVLCWLIAATAVTFLTYGYDKAIAGSRMTRVSERTLLFLAFIGGSVGAFVGMQLFRHKTVKGSFRIRFWGVVAAQVLLVASYFVWLAPRL
jgi:uncharacterized membrane protein YsdA (DUF1294 family)